MLIGTATSAYQVEGNNKWADWWYFERKGDLPYRSGKSCDQYHFYEKDIKIMKSLGFNAYRFSIEFSRIYPSKGKVNREAIEHYRKLVDLLRKNEIEPIVTLWHYTLPKWFYDLGGFERAENTAYFESYVEKIINAGIDAKYFLTMNEPVNYATQGYLMGEYPPFKRSPLAFRRVLVNLIDVNDRTYSMLKKHGYTVSFTNAMYGFKYPKIAYPFYKITDYTLNWWFLKRAKFDFVGINYYRAINPVSFRQHGKGEMNWTIYPQGLYYLISKAYSLFKKPVMITENGFASSDDRERSKFITSHFKYIEEAMRKGIPVIGYLYWSFIDNFEWTYGYTKHFGLVSFDKKTMERHVRRSAFTLKRIADKYRGI